jgi:hypothetical protein
LSFFQVERLPETDLSKKREEIANYLEFCFDTLGTVSFKWGISNISVNLPDHKKDIRKELSKISDDKIRAMFAKGEVLFG